jgi:hypothetical protein
MKTTTLKIYVALLYLTIALNVLDIVLHIATNQAELLRVAGNVLIIAGSGIVLLKRRSNFVLIIGLISYLVLNGIFIALNGIGSAGTMFISLTTIFTLVSLWLQMYIGKEK